jgi:hypothetical protein
MYFLICPSDDWFVIAITDANFGRYQITAGQYLTFISPPPFFFFEDLMLFNQKRNLPEL